ncbi:MAG: phage major tail tube protein [Clostridium beijerinckii]|jgi:P2 family phage contractile tail tube protein|nr:phage major tail tube protein [Clostridium beijerinckii]MCI1578581.1 phage major tail tube protein [Clostridium beijerinckii]MCI1582087.1 phage major tail tube protein [Clostridium beijerinckii]MCI1621937.1 phage major tail tube protein [Clostridium beijerinckii]
MDGISNKVIDYSVYVRNDGKSTKMGDTTSVTLPSVEMLTDTIKGSGISGEIDVPTLGQIGSMETEVALRVSNEKYGTLISANELEYRWVTDVLDPSTGKVSTNNHKAFLKVIPKKHEEGKLESGAAQDGKVTYETLAYKRIINGKEVLNVDKLNGIYAINGVNQLDSVSSNL